METASTVTSPVLECIDGSDDHFKTDLHSGSSVVLSGSGNDGEIRIKELDNTTGQIIFHNANGSVSVDASAATVPVKINGNVISRSPLYSTDILKIGNSVWRLQFPGQQADQLRSATNSIRAGFSNLIGLEELKDFKLKNIFSEVFKKHSFAEMEEQLMTGSMKSTPSLTEIETSWARPWLFSRMLLITVGCLLIFMFSFSVLNAGAIVVPGIMIFGSFAVPLAALVFFQELNAPRNISIFITMALAFCGGVLSLLVTLVFNKVTPFLSELMSASSAGIVEEPAKILIVVAIVGRFTQYKWLLNGLLFGAAVGMGFAAFESAGYAYREATYDGLITSITLRGVLAPFMHIIWTGNAAAALWLVKGDRKFDFSMMKDIRFLRVVISSMLLHIIWNASFTTISIPIFVDLKFIVCGLIGWIICFRLVQTGLSQLNKARHTEVERLSAA